MSRLRSIEDPGIRRVRAVHELLELVDRWHGWESRNMEGAIVTMNKCETLGCPTGVHSSPFCPVCLVELKTVLRDAELAAARVLANAGNRRRRAEKK